MPVPRAVRRAVFGALVVLVFFAPVEPRAADAAPLTFAPAQRSRDVVFSGRESWVWPLWPFRLVRPYVAPAHEYGPGHRGIDIRPGGASVARAPARGVVAFSGSVAGRPLVTIDHGDGLVTTLEPVVSELEPGVVVGRGERVGEIGVGGHADPGTVHFGVRLDGEYINPMLLLGGVPRAVLLPCC